MCPLLVSSFLQFGVTITYSMGINMRFDSTPAQYSPCEGESIGTIGRDTRLCKLIAGELVWSGEEPACRRTLYLYKWILSCNYKYAVLLCDPGELSITDGAISFEDTAVLQPADPNNPNALNGGFIVGTQAFYVPVTQALP